MAESTFKLTYATMFDPPEELHTLFEQVLADVKANFGQEYMFNPSISRRLCLS